MKNVWASQNKGFTIVELLVVVVVIAILAAITIVSYNGIQQRARASQIASAVDTWEKVIRVVAIDNPAAVPLQGCLGSANAFPATADFAEGVCVQENGGDTSVSYFPSSFTAWPNLQQRPNGILPVSMYNAPGSVLKGRGVWIFNSDVAAKRLTLAWVTQQKNQCGRGVPLFPDESQDNIYSGYCGLVINY